MKRRCLIASFAVVYPLFFHVMRLDQDSAELVMQTGYRRIIEFKRFNSLQCLFNHLFVKSDYVSTFCVVLQLSPGTGA